MVVVARSFSFLASLTVFATSATDASVCEKEFWKTTIGCAASWSSAVTPCAAAGTFGYRARTSRSLGRTAGSGAT